MMVFRLLYLGRVVDGYIALVNFWIATYRCVCIVEALVYKLLYFAEVRVVSGF